MPELVCTADDRDAWLAARQSGVTATDIVTILGLSSYDSPYSLYWRKMGHVPETPDNDRLRLGRDLEPIVIERWLEANPDAVSFNGGLYRSAARPWQLATLDRQTAGAPGDGPLEVKTWADADRDSWGPSGRYSGPPAVRAQVLWQMDVMDVPTGHVGVLFLPSGEFRHYVIRHSCPFGGGDHAWCQACEDQVAMLRAGEEFMARLRMELPPPDPDSSAATLAAVRARFAKAEGKRGQVDAELWEEWTDYKHTRAALEAELRRCEIKLREQLGEADEIEVDGQLVGRRVIAAQQVKAHERKMDYLKRVKQKGGCDE